MKLAVLIVPLAILVVGAVILANKGTSVEIFPAEAAENQALESLESAGSDPANWEVKAVCLNMGTCTVSLSGTKDPVEVVAINRYVVKDSKPSLNGSDRIAEVAGRAETHGCFEETSKNDSLSECIRQSQKQNQ
ncbi:MAG: hypothetical protein ACSLFI_00955 [Solirubrobacterales bacterium]